jgi:dedicated sortase system histidine kinase
MPPLRRRRFRESLRFKLLLVSLSLLAIPLAGYRYLVETEQFLRSASEQNLQQKAELIAQLLATQQEPAFRSSFSEAPAIFVHPLAQPIDLDGYGEEWQPLLDQAHSYTAGRLNFRLLSGIHAEQLLLFLQIRDSTIRYAPANDLLSPAADHLLLQLRSETGVLRRYRIATSAPGWFQANPQQQAGPPIRGEWQEAPDGYNLELGFPIELARGGLSVTVFDQATQQPPVVASSSGLDNDAPLARLVLPLAAVESLLQGVVSDGERIQVVDRQQMIVARSGNLSPPHWLRPASLFEQLLRRLLPRPVGIFQTPHQHAGRLDAAAIHRALQGESTVSLQQSHFESAITLSAGAPIRATDGTLLGALLIEKSSHEILSLQQRAFARILSTGSVLLLLSVLALLGYAGRLTGRIQRLNRSVEAAVSPDGRILSNLPAVSERDEIGELSRSFGRVLRRLSEYNRYLESMASRLAHEFRTPLTMVQSSLENLASDPDPQAQSRYLERATEGSRRLSLILQRMREATRLEQSLQQAEREPLQLEPLLQTMLEGYRVSFPDVRFELQTTRLAPIDAAPELIAQALDKLVSNAIDFHQEQTPIRLQLTPLPEQSRQRLSVINQGPTLPETMTSHLFDSMVSLRGDRDSGSHLGLGLYLVRLIAEFHQGRVYAENLPDGSGVVIGMEFPSTANKD